MALAHQAFALAPGQRGTYIHPRLAADVGTCEPGQGREAATVPDIATGRPPATLCQLDEVFPAALSRISKFVKHRCMKHVLVIYNHNLSASYLDMQRLKDPFGIAGNFDSCALFEPPPSYAQPGTARHNQWLEERAGMREQLQSEDGIQFHHFKRKFAQGYPKDHIDHWFRQVNEQLATEGEQIDAIVLPYGTQDYPTMHAWLAQVRQQYPQLKVLVTDPHLGEIVGEGASSSFVRPNHEQARITNGIRKASIDRANSDYTLNPSVDLVTKNLGELEVANGLRGLLGMPPLAARAASKGV